jgi:rfaE bifunctional protein nucleotidyltransferase chain/domain
MKKVIVNGTFDVLHIGHIELLNYAKSQGDYLIVAIDTDLRVKQLKGVNRPMNNQLERKTLLQNLKAVDEVRLFGSDQELIDIVKECSIMVKGSDYRGKPIVGESDIAQIVFFERINGYSSTEKIQHIANRGHLR